VAFFDQKSTDFKYFSLSRGTPEPPSETPRAFLIIVEKRKYDMEKEFDCKSIHKLISGERKTCMGWKYKGEIVIPPN